MNPQLAELEIMAEKEQRWAAARTPKGATKPPSITTAGGPPNSATSATGP